MAVTTLTGTTWIINEIPSIPAYASVGILFTSDSTECTALILTTNYYNGCLMYQRTGGATAVVAYRNDTTTWISESYRTVTFNSEVITEDSNVTQSEFIAWLESNATQVVREISKIKLPDGSEYNFKDTVSGYITSAPVTSVNGQTGNVTVQDVLTAGTGITIANNVISLNVTVVNNEYGGQTVTIGG